MHFNCTNSTLVKHFCWFYREFRERRKQNVIKNELNQHYRVKKSRRVRTQHTFYPCPPPSASELDNYDDDSSDDEFIDYNAVRSACHFSYFLSFSFIACSSWMMIFQWFFGIWALSFFHLHFNCLHYFHFVFKLLPLKCHNYLNSIEFINSTLVQIGHVKFVARSYELKC